MKKINEYLKFLAMAPLVFWSLSGTAQEREISGKSPDLDGPRESEIVQMARTRSYPGGYDEGDLKVQSQLLEPIRKVTPTIKEEPESDSQDD